MRIISGSKRGLKLQSPKGLKTRPTTDRIKETLFNMISLDIPGSLFLDMFAGSGQIGLEAVSRGASGAVFIERDRDAIRCIKENIDKTCFSEEECRLLSGDVFTCIKDAVQYGPYDIIFIDPPYKGGLEEKLLNIIGSADDLLAHNGYLILEAAAEFDLDIIKNSGFSVFKQKKYKTNQHIFIEKE